MKMDQLLGPSWRTTLWGWVAIICGAISFKPELVSFLPDSIREYVVGISGIITFISGGAFAASVKDSKVTGGTIDSKLRPIK